MKIKDITIYEKKTEKYTVIRDFDKIIIKKEDFDKFFELYIFTKTATYMYNLDYYDFCISGENVYE